MDGVFQVLVFTVVKKSADRLPALESMINSGWKLFRSDYSHLGQADRQSCPQTTEAVFNTSG